MNRTDHYGTPAWESSPWLCSVCGLALNENRLDVFGRLCDNDQPHIPNSEA